MIGALGSTESRTRYVPVGAKYRRSCGGGWAGHGPPGRRQRHEIGENRDESRNEKVEERAMTTRNGQHEKERTSTTTDHYAAKAHETVDTIAERAQRAEREVR